QAVQRGCGVYILGDIQTLSGDSPGEPALGEPASAGGVRPDDLQRSLPTPTVL
ncbi:unnamed protein product, partial [Bubo scandiacus]